MSEYKREQKYLGGKEVIVLKTLEMDQIIVMRNVISGVWIKAESSCTEAVYLKGVKGENLAERAICILMKEDVYF